MTFPINWTDIQPASAKTLPQEAEGDRDPEALYASVGRALSYWEALQFTLSFLFIGCSGAAFPYPVMRAFGQSMIVTAKLDMILYAAEASLSQHKELLKKVTDLVKSVRGYNDRRNDIAHGVVQIFAPSSHYLIPTAATARKYAVSDGTTFPEPDYCWTSAQIDRYSRAFQRLNQECGALNQEVNNAIEAAALAAFRERMLGASPGKSSSIEGE